VRGRALLALAARALAALAALAPWGAARAQATNGSVVVLAPSGNAVRGDTLVSITPTFLIQAVGFGPERPLRYVFQIDTTPNFRVPLVFDTLFQSEAASVTIAPNRGLPEGARIYWRATVIDLSGVARNSGVNGSLVVPPWVTPVSPPERAFQPVRTRRPRFVWRSAQVSEPPGPWEYTVRIIPLVGQTITITTRDTSVVPTQELEPNLSYTWRVFATLPRSGQTTFGQLPYSFLVEDSTLATSTILYQNFPNPFPTPTQSITCIWFDLEKPARVQLDIYDLRGYLVRRIVPSLTTSSELPAGRYGRERVEANEGCDSRIGWDGRDSRGTVVPAGVYFLRFRANGIEQHKRILFRGP
jgi:hypothetical protein